MATVLDRVPVDEITTEARDVQFLRTILTVAAAVLFGVGWVIGKLWLSVCWSAVAVRTGWRESQGPRRDGGG